MVPGDGPLQKTNINGLEGGGTIIQPALFRPNSQTNVPLHEPPGRETKSPASPASDNGADLETQQGKAEDTPGATGDQGSEMWDWQKDRADIIVPTQLAIAAYRATRGMIAIRQERDEYEEEDSILLVHPKHIPALIERLQRLVGGR